MPGEGIRADFRLRGRQPAPERRDHGPESDLGPAPARRPWSTGFSSNGADLSLQSTCERASVLTVRPKMSARGVKNRGWTWRRMHDWIRAQSGRWRHNICSRYRAMART